MPGRTLYDKLWDAHVVSPYADNVSLIYIDRQLVHEVSSPQAFAGLTRRRISLRRPATHLAVADHAVPTRNRDQPIADALARAQVDLLIRNTQASGVRYIPLNDAHHGIVHVMGPELGFALPGTTLVCGDSHTATHGAFGALAFGIGASECECVMATQTLRQKRALNLQVCIAGKLAAGVAAKDVALALMGLLGSAGAVGYAIEYGGDTVRRMSMEQRMTLCNMTIEAGSRTGLIAPDETTFDFLKGRQMAPDEDDWQRAVAYWRTLPSDPDAAFDRRLALDAGALAPQVTWGTSPDQVLPVTGCVPDPAALGAVDRARAARALSYMGLQPGMALQEIAIDHVFIGSCTNSRIEDLRAAAQVVMGRTLARGVTALVVPGSGQVKRQAESEGLDRIFSAAGFAWRDPGCSLCVAMNDDRLPAGARCASTSNRNFEGRQGIAARTHLMSPAMAAAAALAGRIVDVREYLG